MALLKLILILLVGFFIVFLVKKIILTSYNLKSLYDKQSQLDTLKQKHGMVFNKKTRKLEADQSPILPFE